MTVAEAAFFCYCHHQYFTFINKHAADKTCFVVLLTNKHQILISTKSKNTIDDEADYVQLLDVQVPEGRQGRLPAGAKGIYFHTGTFAHSLTPSSYAFQQCTDRQAGGSRS